MKVKQHLWIALAFCPLWLLASSSPAHDFPDSADLASHVTNDCLGRAPCSAPSAAQTPTSCPLRELGWIARRQVVDAFNGVRRCQWHSAAAWAANGWQQVSQLAASGLSEVSDVRGHAVTRGFAVTLPAKGEAPRPVAEDLDPTEPVVIPPATSATWNAKRLIEDYMPYDFAIRDWSLGQFTFKRLSARHAHRLGQKPVIAEPLVMARDDASQSSPGEHVAVTCPSVKAVSSAIRLAQLHIADAMGQTDFVSHWAESAADWYLNSLRSSAANLTEIATQWTTEPALQPLYTRPQFILFSDADGTQIVLTAQQAEQWQVAGSPTIGYDNRNSAAGLDVALLAREQLLLGVSSQLERAGQALIGASQLLRSLGSPRIAEHVSQHVH